MNGCTNQRQSPGRSVDVRAGGFTLIELMVAMLLGLVVIAGVSSVFLANMRSSRTNGALGEVQDGSRVSFELMARDIRDAGLTGCNSQSGRVSNLLNNGNVKLATPDWWANWSQTVRGYDDTAPDPAIATGTSAGLRVANTDSLVTVGASAKGATLATDTATASGFQLNEAHSGLQAGDPVMVCDPDHSTILQLNSKSSANTFAYAVAGTPGNCSAGLGYPTVCDGSTGTSYTFLKNALIAKLTAADWYIGNNPAGGQSLYRKNLQIVAGEPKAIAQEMVRNVTDMQITYHPFGQTEFVDARAVSNWAGVNAVRVTLTLQSNDQRAGTDVKPITRKFTSTTTIRNRVN